MNDKLTTHGETRAALIANGFFPCGASGQSGYQHVDEVGALLLIPSHGGVDLSRVPNADARNVCAITVCATDTKARAAILKILAAHLGKSLPYKVDSAGNLTVIAALDFGDGPFSQRSTSVGSDLDPAVAFSTSTKEDAWTFKSSVVTIGDPNSWVNGSPLTVKYESLPKLGDFDALWSEIQSELSKHAAPADYSPKWKAEPQPQTVYGRPQMEPWSDNGSVSPGSRLNPFDNRRQI